MQNIAPDRVALAHVLRDTPPWQWQAREPWFDEFDGSGTSYLAGFGSESAAREYGRRMGWCE